MPGCLYVFGVALAVCALFLLAASPVAALLLGVPAMAFMGWGWSLNRRAEAEARSRRFDGGRIRVRRD